ncbi:MAG: hypothetical protein RL173_594 [Fibrobacterota bacterium]
MNAIFAILLTLLSGANPSLETLMVPGDMIRIDCPRDPKIAGNFTVGEDGLLPLAYGAPLATEGLSTSQLPGKIRSQLSRYFVGTDDIEVTITRKMIRCKAMGHVGAPGWKTIPPNSDLQDLLRLADGMKDGAQMDKLVITNVHLKTPPESFDMTRYLQREAGKAPRALRNGDVVFVPLSPVMGDIQRTLMPYVAPPAEGRRNVVNIIGEIANPGVYEVNGEINIMDLIAMAGGPATPRNSALVLDLENIRVIRQDGRRSVTKTFNMSKYFETGDPTLLVPLRAGDNILIPARKVDVEDKTKVVSVMGAVKNPVTWEISGPTSIVQLLARSGGFAMENGNLLADASRILVVTTDSVSETMVRTWNWREWSDNPGQNSPLMLRANDIVVVPFLSGESKHGISQEATATVLGAVRSPGLVSVGPGTDILQAIALAGGIDMADGDATAILAREVDGKVSRTVFHIRDFFQRDDARRERCQDSCLSPVPRVRPGDRIWIDRKSSREAGFWFELAYKASVSVAVVLSLWAGFQK